MTSSNPSAFAYSAFLWFVVLDMACFAPKARDIHRKRLFQKLLQRRAL